MAMSVKGKTAIITGAGSGINLSFAQLLLSKGCNVVIADLALRPEAEALVSQYPLTGIGPKVVFQKTDVADWAQLDKMFEVAIEHFGGVDIVCPGAGVYEPLWSNFWIPPGTPGSKDANSSSRYALFDINLTHPIRVTQMAIAHFMWRKKPGVILHITSVAGQVPYFPTPMYVASKHALNGFVRSMARLEDPPAHIPKIRVNAVAPARILTPLWTDNPEKMKMVGRKEDAGWVMPEEVAQVMLDLVEKEEYVGGTIVEIGANVRTVEAFNDPGPNASGNGVKGDPGVEDDMWSAMEKMMNGQKARLAFVHRDLTFVVAPKAVATEKVTSSTPPRSLNFSATVNLRPPRRSLADLEMFGKILGQAALLASFAISAADASTPTISAVGNKFFSSNGTQFFIKGVAYQLTDQDPLIDAEQCQRDATLMKTLGANTIRVYHVSPSEDHDGCMTAFADAGIYALIDLDTFNTAINPTVASWNQTQFNAYSKVMDSFASYDNTLGFFVGNEVIALNNQSLAAPYVKAAARDLKAYRNSKGYRNIPVGYSAADIAELRPMLQNYLACGTNSSESIDMFGLNAYEWCGDNTLQTSGYSTLNTYATGYDIPIFFSETGCNAVQPRTFDDQNAIFGSDMNTLWSGAIIYEWIEEANDYGLISYGPNVSATVVASDIIGGYSRAGTPTPVAPDFTNLQNQWKTLNPTGVASSAYSPTLTPPACPSSTAGGWLVDGDVKLPSIGQTQVVSATGADAASTTATGTGTAASPSSTKGSANGGKEIAGMSVGLVAVMLGFMYWL
ncbi:hypothetical protein G7Y89_g3351 [Cudoniella acicularis]|uniref:1,3-beta-glucanosyltransferase n=1 Tax=Cudoniella acicularis TaxID=354080 RepID=A0A8H4RRJ0_9HELO|nr:hypothetical protein G7Y89_g3351 [Cudoniella acicularis]